jgi:predicted acylesterase/phospholipase RssA
MATISPEPALTAQPPALPPTSDVRELRLALVCYGGVSLAIYMHGITKELEKIARASTAFVAGDDNPFDPGQTEYAYFNALRRKAAADGFRTRVVVDIIAGTSAGGINGVCLAKAVALDAPQDGLRDLWLTKGAILKLLARVPKLPPLAGNRMLKWLGGAFGDMDGKSQGTLMPDGLALNLFVTTTDINGYTRQIPISDPPAIGTVINKHVFEFAARDGEGNLDESHNAALAFAARATSCFPGAFPATKLSDITHEEARRRFPEEFCRVYELAGAPVDLTYFVDGGVLDNFPFKHAVRAIAGKPAATEVDRRLLFIEPDPAQRKAAPDGRAPGFGATIWAGLSKLPRRQPIADALDELMGYNRRVRRVKQMIQTVEPDVLRAVRPLLEERFADANEQANTGAIASSGFAFQAYLHLKLLSVVEGMAAAISRLLEYPPTTTQALFVQQALLHWADDEGLLRADGPLTAEQVRFLRTFDLGYGQRRLAFVIGRLKNHYAAGVDRGRLNALKHRLYELQGELKLVLPQADFLRGDVDAIFGAARIEPFLERWRVGDFLETARPELGTLRKTLDAYLEEALRDFGSRTYGELERLTAELPLDVRDDLRARYLGFPYWDATIFPARALSDVAELDEVQVVRVSPLDARQLVQAETAKDKLHGVALGHFGAFFRRSWRENDYLWGRLDGAERLLWLLGDTSTLAANEAFAAIAAEERSALKKASALIRKIDSHVAGALDQPAPAAAKATAT